VDIPGWEKLRFSREKYNCRHPLWDT